MALGNLTDPSAVHSAVHEFESLGRDAFLAKYGFHRSRSYFLVLNGKAYDSKAIAGAAHGYQYPELGPLPPSDFSGGNATVRARLQTLGFDVVVSEPTTAPARSLTLFEDYTRREAHDIFAPDTDFTPGAGLWGIQGIIEHEPGEFLLFVSFGREQGGHSFDEGMTVEGVLTWQSQPDQDFADPQVQRLIAHDPERTNVRLFLRTRARQGATAVPYTYLGRLAYITHDSERERPVHFQWQVIDLWPPPTEVLTRMGLQLSGETSIQQQPPRPSDSQTRLLETPLPPPTLRSGTTTALFRARRSPDRSMQDARNRALGLAGELAVVVHEQDVLRIGGRDDLAARVRHVAAIEGDGAGYDIASFETDGADKFIEVKTTRSGLQSEFYVSANEVEFSRHKGAAFWLYRLYDFDESLRSGKFYTFRGPLDAGLSVHLEPVQFRVRITGNP
jgi:uncharacterized protein DUF3883/uncharacterized protein DUF3427